jgi:hypothetical protein
MMAVNDCAQAAYHDISEQDSKTIFLVIGADPSLNGRYGTVRFLDLSKRKFCIGLDTKKGQNEQEMFIKLEHMDLNAP